MASSSFFCNILCLHSQRELFCDFEYIIFFILIQSYTIFFK